MSSVGVSIAVVVGVPRRVEEHVAELVREREARPPRANAGAIEEDHVAHAGRRRSLMNDSPMRPLPAKIRDHDELDGRRIAVVERLHERALLERARHRVHVAEVLEAVGEIDGAERTLSVASVDSGSLVSGGRVE